MDLSSLPYSSYSDDCFLGLKEFHDFLSENYEDDEIKIDGYNKYLKRYYLNLKKRFVKTEIKILEMENGISITLQKVKTEEHVSEMIVEIETQYIIFLKDQFGYNKHKIKTIDKNPFFFEIKENGFNYAVICENNILHIIFYNIYSNQLKKHEKITLNMKVYSFLKISENFYRQ